MYGVMCRTVWNVLVNFAFMKSVLSMQCMMYVVQQLSESLDEFGEKWELNPADGAFYGPKV